MSRALRIGGWWLLAMISALACVGSAVDRLARIGVLVAAPSWLPTGGNASLGRAEQAWRAGDLERAAALARAGVLRRPIDAPALRIAGGVALAQGQASTGEGLLRLAGAAGWRDLPTQLFWAEAALAQRAWDVAAQRVEAVARLGDSADVGRLLPRLEATRAGRAALVRRWGAEGGWLLAELRSWPTQPLAMANRFATIEALRPQLSQATKDRLAAPLLRTAHIDWAFAIADTDRHGWDLAPDGQARPLGWSVSAAVGLDAAIEEGGQLLHVRASGAAVLPLAQRLLHLPAGATRLQLSIMGAQTDLPVIATLSCVRGQGATAEPAVGRFAFDLRVPPGCSLQQLGLAVAGEEARRGADLRLRPPTFSRGAAAP